MNVIAKLSMIFWLTVLGYLALYAWGLFLGVFSPGEVVVFTVTAAVLAALFLVHMAQVHKAMHDHRHSELMRSVHRLRERRGF